MDKTGPRTETSTSGRRDVYVVDDDADVRKSLHFLLSLSSMTAWPFAAAADFIEQLDDLRPAPILLDMRMPGIDGLQLLAILKARKIDWPVIMITAHGDVTTAVRAMKLGAIEFLEKPFEPAVLDSALERAFAAIDRSRHSLMARNNARRLLDQLSAREREIASVLVTGVANKEAAHRLGLSVRTVEMHRSNALTKMGVRSIAEILALIAAADQPDWMTPRDVPS